MTRKYQGKETSKIMNIDLVSRERKGAFFEGNYEFRDQWKKISFN